MLDNMFGLCQASEISDVVIGRVSIVVVNDHPSFDRTVGSFPNDMRTETPRVRIVGFYPYASAIARLRITQTDGSDGQSIHFPARLKFGRGRQVNTLFASIPRSVTSLERRSVRLLPRSKLVPDKMRSISGIFDMWKGAAKNAATMPGTKSSGQFPIRPHGKTSATYLAGFIDHGLTIIDCQSGIKKAV
jgi:hypothetical protein